MIEVVLITAANEEEAARLARVLVEEGLAACVNIVREVRSIYRWRGKVCDDREALLIAKTRASLVPRLALRVKELSSYELPETVALPVAGGSDRYLEWVAAEVSGAPAGEGAGSGRS